MITSRKVEMVVKIQQKSLIHMTGLLPHCTLESQDTGGILY